MKSNNDRNLKRRNKREVDRLSKIEIQWVDGELLMESFNAKVCTGCKNLKSVNKYNKKKMGALDVSSKCKICRAKIRKIYYKENKETILKRSRKRYVNNKKKINKQRVEYQTKRRRIDIDFKLKDNIQSRINSAIKRNSKFTSIIDLLGITIQEFKKYLERQFEDGMSWDNYGEWHIDHIIPCSWYDLSKPHHQEECFYYTNLQPLWAKDNLKKSNKL